MGLLDSVFTKIRRTNIFDVVTSQSLNSAETIKTLSSDFQYNALCIQIDVADSSAVTNIGVIGRNYSALSNATLPIVSQSGAKIQRIQKSGLYYVDITGVSDITVYNYTAVNTTAKISYTLIGEMPIFPQTFRPIQRLASVDITMTSATEYTIATRVGVSDYKFLFVSVYSTGSGGSAKNQTFNVSIQPYHSYSYSPGAANAKAGAEYTILSVTSQYSAQSDWQQVLGDYLSAFLKVSSPTAGDIFHINIYGVR